MEKFDFSKIEDQKKFDNLPEKEREEIVGEVREEAENINKTIEKIIKRLTDSYVNLPIEIKESSRAFEKILSLPEVQQATKEAIVRHYTNDTFRIKKDFSIPEDIFPLPKVQQIAKKEFIRKLKNGSVVDAVNIKEDFAIPEEFISSLEVQQAAKEAIIKRYTGGGEINLISQLRERLSIPENIIQQAVKEGMIKHLIDGNIDTFLKIKEEFSISEDVVFSPEIQKAAIRGFSKCVKENLNSDAVEIKNKFNLPEEIIQKIVLDRFFYGLSLNLLEYCLEIKDEFNLLIQPSEIIKKIPEIKEFTEKIKKISPDFYKQTQKSVELLLKLFEFKNNQEQFFETIKINPFLLDAVAENPRFGSKLLLKYPQLDELSQQNIEFLFDTKKEIMKENPEIPPESLEFRRLMQKKLKNYESNQEILEEIGKSGINIDQWLNHSDTQYFSLESGKSNLAFSETVSTPLNRIKETINSYSHQIKEVLKEYKQELSGCQIPLEDSKEFEDKIVQMREEQEKARAERNEKKAQGIQKGIDGLTQKLADLKTVSSWDKVLGDINAFDQLKNDVFGTQEKLIQAENEFAEKTSGKTPSGKEIQEAKQGIAKAKEELRSKFGLLENRIESFKVNLPNLIEPALGKERTEFLIQEIETNLAEQFDHYNTDRSDLANLFSEKSDKEKDKMDSQPMSIFVWARNPDIDLYQGNYSDCCIKINSEHMGAESTIADYNTDLGVQIVNIWDETKNEPVTAAWCWLGKNEKGETSLVVDNIESNTLYSSNYPEQLTEELFDYLKDYAKAIGVKKIVLGKSNNDLPTSGELAKLIDDKSEYGKIGGYNRADGYFLEAEENKVKIIWEAKQKESKNKAKGKNKITEVEFTEANARDLNKNDFETIKKMERKVYRGTDLIQGQAMIEDIKNDKGLDYSIILYGKNLKTGKTEAIGYIVAVEDETDESDESIYLEDIAVLPEAQGQGLGWNLFRAFIEKLKAKALKENKSMLLDMHLRENSQRFMERHRQDLEGVGVKLIEEALVADYYDEGEDALYQVYEVKVAP